MSKIGTGTGTSTTLFTYGNVSFSGFGSGDTSSSETLYVSAKSIDFADGCFGNITAYYGSSSSTLISLTSNTSQTSYSCTVPSGTDLSTISVNVRVDAKDEGATCFLYIYDIKLS
jgi:hypothetical protein